MKSCTFGQKQGGCCSSEYPKIFRMDCSLAKTKHMDTHTHTVKREFFLPVCGFILSLNCMISCTIAEYYLEAKS